MTQTKQTQNVQKQQKNKKEAPSPRSVSVPISDDVIHYRKSHTPYMHLHSTYNYTVCAFLTMNTGNINLTEGTVNINTGKLFFFSVLLIGMQPEKKNWTNHAIYNN